MKDIVVCIPNYNGAEYLEKLVLQNDLDYVVMDNCSTDDSVAVCERRGIRVIRNTKTIDRVKNWIRCLEWFQCSDYQWLKWLFIGDSLVDNAGKIMRQAVAGTENASVVVFEYDVDYGNDDVRQWKVIPDCDVLNASDLPTYLLRKGNVFGSPVGIMIRKNDFSIIKLEHEFIWAADEYLHYKLGELGFVYFVDKKIGTFDAKSRKHFQKLSGQLNSQLEELEMLRMLYYKCQNTVSESEMMEIFIRKLLPIVITVSPRYTYLLRLYNKLIRRER